MREIKKVVLTGFLLFFAAGMLLQSSVTMNEVQAAGKVYINKKRLTMYKGDTYKLKIYNTTKKVKWSSNKKKVVSVAKKGKITAHRKGKAVITAKVGKKKYICRVTVKKREAKVPYEASQVLALVNQQRAAYGLAPLTMDTKLNQAANKRAMEISQVFDHTRPNGTSCFTVLGEYNISYGFAGENIAAGFSTPESVVQTWMNSPGHRANILNSNYKKLGIGYYVLPGSAYTYHWVQIFTD